eukprot:6954329-Prymnesium_polylepis.1
MIRRASARNNASLVKPTALDRSHGRSSPMCNDGATCECFVSRSHLMAVSASTIGVGLLTGRDPPSRVGSSHFGPAEKPCQDTPPL